MSKRAKPDPDLAQWCAALAQVTAPVDVVPPGFYQINALAAKLKQQKTTLKRRVRVLLAEGKCERRTFRVRLKHATRPVAHYRLK